MANIFPRWSNLLPLKIAVCAGTAAAGVALAFAYYATPKTLTVGYQPSQPIPFSHKIHVDQLGLDCRYCHSFVDVSGHSNVPTGSTCWNCHQHVQRDSPKLAPLHKSMDPTYPGYDGKPIEWVRVHKSPDYVYFNHSAHVNRGISCQSCHGDVNKMEVVYQDAAALDGLVPRLPPRAGEEPPSAGGGLQFQLRRGDLHLQQPAARREDDRGARPQAQGAVHGEAQGNLRHLPPLILPSVFPISTISAV